MELQGRELEYDMDGNDVRLLHVELGFLGKRIAKSEIDSGVFGDSTRAVVEDLQAQLGLPVDGIVDEPVAARINAMLGERGLAPALLRGVVLNAAGVPSPDVWVEAFDKDLRSDQKLGRVLTNGAGVFQIVYHRAAYEASESGRADLVVHALDASGAVMAGVGPLYDAAAATYVTLIEGEGVPAPAPLSEFERVLADVAPLLEGIELAALTSDDVAHLSSETGHAVALVTRLSTSAALRGETGLSMEAFYGWASSGVSHVLDELLATDDATLKTALETAITGEVIPASMGEAIDGIIVAVGRLRQRVDTPAPTDGELRAAHHQVVGQLVDSETSSPLAGLTVEAYDNENPAEPVFLNVDESDDRGFFPVALPIPSGGPSTWQLKLRVLDGEGIEIHAQAITVQSTQRDLPPLSIVVPPSGAPADPSLGELSATSGIAIPSALSTYLAGLGVTTLGGLVGLGLLRSRADLPVATDDPAVTMLDGFASLSALSSNVVDNAAIMAAGFSSVAAVARSTRAAFVTTMQGHLGDGFGAQIHGEAVAQDKFVRNVFSDALANTALGIAKPHYSSVAALLPRSCACDPCTAAMTPLPYLADLTDYSVDHIRDGAAKITLAWLEANLHQPFGSLPTECGAVEARVRQVRLCVEVLRSYLAAGGLPQGEAAPILAAQESRYRLEAYKGLLARLGTSYEEIRLASHAPQDARMALADRIGIDLATSRPDELDALMLSPATMTEAMLEDLFGLVDTTRDPLADGPVPSLRTWRLQHLRTVWKAQDFPDDVPAEGEPVIDPDVIGPADFRHPFEKAAPQDPDAPFDLWLRRRSWVDARLDAFASIVAVDDKLAALGTQISYEATSLTPWSSVPTGGELDALRTALTSGTRAEVDQALADLAALRLAPEAFLRLMEIRAEEAPSSPLALQVARELDAILVEVQIRTFSSTWVVEENALDAGSDVFFGPKHFWPALRTPGEGPWPPIRAAALPDFDPRATTHPLIDPETVRFRDLAVGEVGTRARDLWNARSSQVEGMRAALETELATNGFAGARVMAFGDLTGTPAEDFSVLDARLKDPGEVDQATADVHAHLHMPVETFARLFALTLKASPTVDETREIITILASAQKIRTLHATWLGEEADPVTGVTYWKALFARLPAWRATSEERRSWTRALAVRSRSPIIDPDLIGPGDIKSPVAGDPAYDLWAARRLWVDAAIASMPTTPPPSLDVTIEGALGVDVTGLEAIAAEEAEGEDIGRRVEQLSLTLASFRYLLRLIEVHAQATLLTEEWDEMKSILVQAMKRRESARWRQEEKTAIIIGPDLFELPVADRTAVPPPPPRAVEPWRGTIFDVRAFQDTLRSRIEQEAATLEALATAVSETEAATLPRLRDALVAASDAPSGPLPERAQWLADRLLIDTKNTGCQITTRVAQAIETLQELLFGARTVRFGSVYPTLALDADHFDLEWRWIGSYASWRAAIFVFLYPENIVAPSLRREQTPVFRAALSELRSNRQLNPALARDIARQYQEYFDDVRNLRVRSTCQTETNVFVPSSDGTGTFSPRTLFYMFATSTKTGRVYWSAYDPEDDSGYAQSFWQTVPGLDRTLQLCGVTAYELSADVRYLYVFAVIPDRGVRRLVFTRYDLDERTWDDEPTELELPEDFRLRDAVVQQTYHEHKPPLLAVRERGGAVYLRDLDDEGETWREGEWIPLVGPELFGDWAKLCAVIDLDAFVCLIVETTSGELQYRLLHPRLRKSDKDDGRWRAIPDSQGFRGAFRWPGTGDVVVLYRKSGVSGTWQVVIRPELRTVVAVPLPAEPGLFNTWLADGFGVSLENVTSHREGSLSVYDVWAATPFETYFDPDPFGIDAFIKQREGMALKQRIQDAEWSDETFRFWKSANRQVGRLTGNSIGGHIKLSAQSVATKQLHATGNELSVAVPSTLGSVSFAIPSGASKTAERRFAYTKLSFFIAMPPVRHRPLARLIDLVIAAGAPVQATPVSTGFAITEQLTADDLVARRAATKNALEANAKASRPVRTYVEEGAYFLPVAIAMALHQRGHFVAALDWWRTVYDYTTGAADRKTYYGLVMEEDLGTSFDRPEDWLRDPLDPHAIAETRAGAYTRFTVYQIVQTLLAFADSEYTLDTPETVPRARRLYLKALELLDTSELVPVLGACADTIGSMTIEVGDPSWTPVLSRQKNRLAALRDADALEAALQQIEAALGGAGPVADRVAQVISIVDAALGAQPAAPTLDEATSGSVANWQAVQAALQTQESFARALVDTGRSAANDTLQALSRVTGLTATTITSGTTELAWLREIKPLAVADPGPPVGEDGDLRWNNPLAPSRKGLFVETAVSSPVAMLQASKKLAAIFTPAPSFSFCVPPNSTPVQLRRHAEVNLYKIRDCRNIAGLRRALDPYAAPTDTTTGMPVLGAGGNLVLPGAIRLRPTPFRYSYLIERAKQLTAMAQQFESTFLNTLEKGDAERYSLMRARQDVRMARATVRLQDLRVKEAESGIVLAELQRDRAEFQADHFEALLQEGASSYENNSLQMLAASALLQFAASAFNLAAIPVAIGKLDASQALSFAAGAASAAGAGVSTLAQLYATMASFERREQEWEFQRALAEHDIRIGSQQVRLAEDRLRIVGQERTIAVMQEENSEAIVEFLSNKFTSAELYEWMAGILVAPLPPVVDHCKEKCSSPSDCKEACSSGDALGCWMAAKRSGLPQAERKVFKERARQFAVAECERGDARACYTLALLTGRAAMIGGYDCEMAAEAIAHQERACHAGCAEACYDLAIGHLCIDHDPLMATRDPGKGEAMLELACGLGHTRACERRVSGELGPSEHCLECYKNCCGCC